MRHRFFALVFVVALLFGVIPGAMAQNGTPVASPEGLGFHELSITFSESAFQMPAQVSAGRTHLTLTNEDENNIHVFIVRLPDGAGLEIMAELANGFPEWFVNGLPGTADFVPPGRQGQAVIDLTPGLHLIARVTVPGQPPQVVLPFEVVEVSASSAAAAAEPQAEGDITMVDFGFDTDLGNKPLIAGQHWWKITNEGTYEHEFEVTSVPDGTTIDEVIAALARPEGTPVPDGQLDLTRQTLITSPTMVGGVGLLSPGATAWFALDLEPGTYVAFCPIPDGATDQLHSQLGMFALFTVEA